MARTITCKLCRAAIRASVAAHNCPHGQPCRYLCGEDGLPVDWSTPECRLCRVADDAVEETRLLDDSWVEGHAND